MHSAADEDILAFSLKLNAVVITLDADFHAILAVSGASFRPPAWGSCYREDAEDNLSPAPGWCGGLTLPHLARRGGPGVLPGGVAHHAAEGFAEGAFGFVA